MPVDTSILMGYRPPQIESQDAQNARAAQMMSAQQQNMLGQMQLADKAREQQMNNALNAAYKNAYTAEGGLDTNVLRQKLAEGGFGSKLPELEKRIAEIEVEKLKKQELQGKVTAQPFELSKKQSEAVQERLKQTKEIYERLDPNDPTVGDKYLAIHNAVHDDPILGPLLTKMGIKKADSLADINRSAATPQGMQDLINRSIMGAQKFIEFTAPKTDVGKLIAERDRLAPGDPTRKLYDDAIKKATTQSPGTNVKVELSTEKKYGEKFAGNVADSDIKLKDAAEAAPQLAETSNRISQILKSGQVFTGTGANIKLQLAKALKVAGGTDNEAIANTETLISSLASQTLANIKSSGLGSGQGFTDKDRDFLQAATAGNITLDNKTLQRLSDLSYRTAVASANRWKERVDKIPKSAIEGTGISTESISIPSREGGATRKPTAVQLEADAILNAKPSGGKK
jgi:hypothetical protein